MTGEIDMSSLSGENLLFAIKRMRCPESLSISWVEIPPYIYNSSDGKVAGVFQKILKDMVEFCCKDRTALNYSKSAFGLTEFQSRLQNGTNDIFLPVYGDGKKKHRLGEPFISIVDSPGIAYFYGNLGSAQDAMINAFSTSWPVLVVVLLFALAVGTAFWVAEVARFSYQGRRGESRTSTSGQLKETLCKTFEGPCDGFYWAMVTLTTVGYGDLSPRTVVGRVVAIIWILFGTVILSMFTASITTGLITACLSNDIPLAGAKVAVISNSQEAGVAMKKNAIPIDYPTVEKLSTVLKNGETEGLLLDIYVAGYYQNLFEKFLLADVIEYVFTYGLLLRNEGTWMDQCFRAYNDINKDQLFKDMSTSVVPFKTSNYGNQASKKSSTLIDWSSRPLQFFLATIGSLLLLLIISGIAFDRFLRRRHSAIKNEKCKNIWLEDKDLQIQRQEHLSEKCGAYFQLQEELNGLGKSIEEMMKQYTAEMQGFDLEKTFNGNMYRDRQKRV